jgi:hypothetical protein
MTQADSDEHMASVHTPAHYLKYIPKVPKVLPECLNSRLCKYLLQHPNQSLHLRLCCLLVSTYRYMST